MAKPRARTAGHEQVAADGAPDQERGSILSSSMKNRPVE
jgi:hypothetical protein